MGMEIFAALIAGLMLFAVWRMFRGRHGVIEKDVDRAFDVSEGQPEAPEALELFRASNWSALTRLYWRIPPSDRYHLIEALSLLHPDLPQKPAEDADSSVLTIVGGLLLFHGARLQGTGPALSVLKADAPRRMQELQESARLLREASGRNPNDSTNLSLQILMEHLTTVDHAQINSLIGRVQASGEDNLYAALNHMLVHAPRHTGHADAMWRVANEWASSPPNAAWLAIPARAHIEEWFFAMQLSPPNAPERLNMIDLQSDDNFIRHIAKLDDLFWAAQQRGEMSGAESSFAHNHFAFLMHIFKVQDRAKPHLERIGSHIARYPWIFLPTGASRPTLMLRDLRRQYGLPPL